MALAGMFLRIPQRANCRLYCLSVAWNLYRHFISYISISRLIVGPIYRSAMGSRNCSHTLSGMVVALGADFVDVLPRDSLQTKVTHLQDAPLTAYSELDEVAQQQKLT